MKTKSHSDEHMRFRNLLGRIVDVSKAEVDRRMAEAESVRQSARENGQRAKRARPIVSPDAASSAKSHF